MPRPLCHVNVKKDLKLENKILIYKYNILQTKNLTQKYMYVRNQNVFKNIIELSQNYMQPENTHLSVCW